MLNQAQQLSIAYIVLYALLAQPTLFVWIKHGRPGFLGWYLLLAFCLVRIIGPALSLTNPTSMPAMILSGVGLSPLMIAIIGIMHESNHYIAGKKLWYLGLGPYINIHLGIGAASALIVVGKINLGLAVLVKVGVALIAATWVVFAVYGYLSYLEPKEDDGAYGVCPTPPLPVAERHQLTFSPFASYYSQPSKPSPSSSSASSTSPSAPSSPAASTSPPAPSPCASSAACSPNSSSR